MADDPDRLIIETAISLDGVKRDLARIRTLAVSYGDKVQNEIGQRLGNAFGKTAAPKQYAASLSSIGTASSATGAKIQQLTTRIALQHRSFDILKQQLTATTAKHGTTAIATQKQALAVDKLSLAIRTNQAALEKQRTALTSVGTSSSTAATYLSSFGKNGGLAGAALTAIPYAGIAAGVLGIYGAYKLLKPAIVDTNATLEMNQRQWTVMLGGNAEAARGLLGEFKQLANVAPFDFGDVNAAAKMLKGAGVPAKELLGYLTDIGNVASTFGENPAQGVESITRALAQIRTSGRVNAEDVGQLTTQGIPAWQILADAIGKTVAETRKLSEAGKITGDVFTDAFREWSQENFGTAMADAATTFTGSMATINDSLKYGSAQVFQPFFELIRDGAVSIAEFVKSDEFAAWSARTATYVALAADTIRDLLTLIGIDIPTAAERSAQGTATLGTASATVVKAVDTHKEAQKGLNDTLDSTKERLEAAERALGPFEDAAEVTGATLDKAKARFDRFASAAIAGSQAFSDAIFAVQQDQARAQLDLLDFTNGPLQDMLAPMQRDIDAATDSVEDWADRVEDAEDALAGATDEVERQEAAMRDYENAVSSAKDVLDEENQRLDESTERLQVNIDARQAQIDVLDEWQSRSLVGDRADKERLQVYDDEINRIEQLISRRKLAGADRDDEQLKNLDKQLDRVQEERNLAKLEIEAGNERKRREAADLASSREQEYSYGDVTEGITSALNETERLTEMLPGHEAAVESDRLAVEQAQLALDNATTAQEQQTRVIQDAKIQQGLYKDKLDETKKSYDDQVDSLDALEKKLQKTEAEALKPYEERISSLAVAEQRLTLQRGLALDALERERDLLANPPTELPWDEIEAGLRREAVAVGEATVAHQGAEAALKARKDEIKLMRRELEELEVQLANLAKAAATPSSGMGDDSYTPPNTPATALTPPTGIGAQWAAIKQEIEPVTSWLSGTALPVVGKAMDDLWQTNLPALREGTKNEFAIINDVGTKFAAYWVNEVMPQIRNAWKITQEQELPALKGAYSTTFGEIQASIDNTTKWFRDEAWPTWSSTYDAMRLQGLDPLQAAFKTAWGLSGSEGMWGTVSTSLSGMYDAVLVKFGLTEQDGIQGIVAKASPVILKWVLHPYQMANASLLDAAGPLAQLGLTFSGWVDVATVAGGALYDASLKAGTSIVTSLQAGITEGWETFTTWWKGKLEGLLALVPEGMRRFLPGGGGAGGPKVNPSPMRGDTLYDADSIEEILKNTGLKGQGDAIARLAEKYNISPALALGMFRKEASFLAPENNLSVANNNPGNIRDPDGYYGGVAGQGNFRKYASVEEGIEAYFKVLNREYRSYIDSGDIAGLVARYAPASDDNNVPLYVEQLNQWIAEYLEQITASPLPTSSTAAAGARTRGSVGQPGDPVLTDRAVDQIIQGGKQNDSFNARRDMNSDGDYGDAGDVHAGLDIGGAAGSAVRTPVGGRVTFAAPNQWGGTAVIIEDAQGLQWYYGHLRGDIKIAAGQNVDAQDVLGYIDAQFMHTHMQLRNKAGNNVDPTQMLEAMAAGRGAGAFPDQFAAQAARGTGDPKYPPVIDPGMLRDTNIKYPPVVDPEMLDDTNAKMEFLLRLLEEMMATLDPSNPASVEKWAKRVQQAIQDLIAPTGGVTEELESVTAATVSMAEAANAARAAATQGVSDTDVKYPKPIDPEFRNPTYPDEVGDDATYGMPSPVASSLMGDTDIGSDLGYGISDPIAESILTSTDSLDTLKDALSFANWQESIEAQNAVWEQISLDTIQHWREAIEYFSSGRDLALRWAKDVQNAADSAAGAARSITSGGAPGGGTTAPAGNTNNITINTRDDRRIGKTMASIGMVT